MVESRQNDPSAGKETIKIFLRANSTKVNQLADNADRKPGILYVVATPIGNLQDITLRALEVLRGVDLVIAEDTRRTRKLLSHYEIHAPLESYHGHSGPQKAQQILRTLQQGKSVALLSDSGTPAVSDPGAKLVALCQQDGIKVVPIPGPSAVTAAFSVAGVSSAGFIFAGYPPRQDAERCQFLRQISSYSQPVVFYESPHRIAATVQQLAQICPQRRVIVARELTKMYEELRWGRVEEIAGQFAEEEQQGEFTVVLAATTEAATEPTVDEHNLEQAAREMLAAGLSARDAARILELASGLSRNEAYDLVQKVLNP